MSTAIQIATQSFVADTGERVEKGERVVDGHDLCRRYPQHFRAFTLDDELRVRSDRVRELADRAVGEPHRAEPLSRAGREEQREDNFWRSVDRELHRDVRTSEERTTDEFYDRALDQVERLDSARLAELTDGYREAWGGRLPLEQ